MYTMRDKLVEYLVQVRCQLTCVYHVYTTCIPCVYRVYTMCIPYALMYTMRNKLVEYLVEVR